MTTGMVPLPPLLLLVCSCALLAPVAAPAAYQASRLLPADGSTVPSARHQAAACAAAPGADSSFGSGWLFGGHDSVGSRNDLWQHTSGDGWSHLGGGGGQRGVYSNLGGAAFVDTATAPPVAWPGSRLGATLFSTADGRLHLFGGYGTGAAERIGYLNDLWIFLGTEAGWTWWGGSDEVDQLPCTLRSGCQQLCPSSGTEGTRAPCSWPGGRRSASFWQDGSVRRSSTTARVLNPAYESDELPEVGFFYTSPEDWGANGTVVVVRNGIYRWGIAHSGESGQYVALLSARGASSSISQRVDGLTPSKQYLVSWRAASGFAEGEWLRVLINGRVEWSGQPPDQFLSEPETLVFTAPPEGFVDLAFAGWHSDESAGEALQAVFVDDVELTRAHLDTVYIFGGVGCDTSSCHAFHSLNDLWWYVDDTFRFVQGSLGANEIGRYPVSVALNSNPPTIWPGSRSLASGWYDPVANTGVIFGGKGCDALECASYSYLNDLWTFDSVYVAEYEAANSSIFRTQYLGGSLSCNANGNYPRIGQQTDPWPGARESPAVWVDNGGNAYIFGGSGFDEDGVVVMVLSDLWKWQTSVRSWMWMGGLSYGNGLSFGTGVEMWPGARGQAATWYDSVSEAAWIFGGKQAGSTASPLLNELWLFAPDDYAACSSAPLEATINLTAYADVSTCELSSAQRSCIVDSCTTDYIAKGTGQVDCIVQTGFASLVFEAAEFSCTFSVPEKMSENPSIYSCCRPIL